MTPLRTVPIAVVAQLAASRVAAAATAKLKERPVLLLSIMDMAQ